MRLGTGVPKQTVGTELSCIMSTTEGTYIHTYLYLRVPEAQYSR